MRVHIEANEKAKEGAELLKHPLLSLPPAQIRKKVKNASATELREIVADLAVALATVVSRSKANLVKK